MTYCSGRYEIRCVEAMFHNGIIIQVKDKETERTALEVVKELSWFEKTFYKLTFEDKVKQTVKMLVETLDEANRKADAFDERMESILEGLKNK